MSKKNLEVDWGLEPKSPTDDACEFYQCNNSVSGYDYEHMTEFVDDYSTWDDDEDDYEVQRKEKNMKKKIKKLTKRIRKIENRVFICEENTENIKSDVSFIKNAHRTSEKKRKQQLCSQLINEPDYNKRKQLSDELFDNSWDGDYFDLD